MNLLFITIAWPLPGERNLYTDLMDEFALHGHNVYVIGTHNSRDLPKSELKEENGLNVLRVYSGKIRKTLYLRKTISLLTLDRKILKSIKKYLSKANFDLIIGPTPPIIFSRLHNKLKKRFKAPFYLLLKDIWPQGSVDLKVFRKCSIPWLYLRSHEIRLYKTADYIGCMSPMGVDYILSKNRFIPKTKVEVCPNCIRPDNKTITTNSGVIRSKHNIPSDACVFLFSGNLGIGHGLAFLVKAIKSLKNYPKAYFVIGGSGTHFQFLKNRLKEFEHKNVFLYEWLPREDFTQILATIDVGLILLYRYTVPQFPSRLLSYLEYSKPVLCAVNKYTDIGTIVEKTGCGYAINHGDLDAFISAVKYLSENENERKNMGENGRKLLMDNYTASHGYNIIMNHFNV